jgi:hypothetical protein
MLTSEVRHHTNVVQFQMTKPANLPFHVLAWGQQYVRAHNCYQFYAQQQESTAALRQRKLLSTSTSAENGTATGTTADMSKNSSTTTFPEGHSLSSSSRPINSAQGTAQSSTKASGASEEQLKYFDAKTVFPLNRNRMPTNKEVFDICEPNAIVASVGGPVTVTYMKKFDIVSRHRSARMDMHGNSSASKIFKYLPGIKYVYFTESDQVVHFDSFNTLAALSSASNESTFFVGKRREKARDSHPAEYMSNLNIWRECGSPGYSIKWPAENIVQID